MNSLPINYIIMSCSLLWLFSFIGFFFSYNFIIQLISLELMFLAISTIMCTFSFQFIDVNGQMFALFIIVIVAIESTIALSLYVMITNKNKIKF